MITIPIDDMILKKKIRSSISFSATTVRRGKNYTDDYENSEANKSHDDLGDKRQQVDQKVQDGLQQHAVEANKPTTIALTNCLIANLPEKGPCPRSRPTLCRYQG